MSTPQSPTHPLHGLYTRWHSLLSNPTLDVADVQTLLHEELVFHTPLELEPRTGNALGALLLSVAKSNMDHFEYVQETFSEEGNVWMLQFQALVEGQVLRGVDVITCKDEKIVKFEVMMRPVAPLLRFGEMQMAKMAKLMGN